MSWYNDQILNCKYAIQLKAALHEDSQGYSLPSFRFRPMTILLGVSNSTNSYYRQLTITYSLTHKIYHNFTSLNHKLTLSISTSHLIVRGVPAFCFLDSCLALAMFSFTDPSEKDRIC